VLQLWEEADGFHGGDFSTAEAVDLMHSDPASAAQGTDGA
jgi:hypothetical protein